MRPGDPNPDHLLIRLRTIIRRNGVATGEASFGWWMTRDRFLDVRGPGLTEPLRQLVRDLEPGCAVELTVWWDREEQGVEVEADNKYTIMFPVKVPKIAEVYL